MFAYLKAKRLFAVKLYVRKLTKECWCVKYHDRLTIQIKTPSYVLLSSSCVYVTGRLISKKESTTVFC